jgi:hypothetical protein
MKRLSVALFLWLALFSAALAENVVGPSNLILCNKTAFLNPAAAGTTQIAAPVTGQAISICGWQVTNVTTAGTVLIFTGSGATCGTSTVNVTPTFSASITSPVTDHTQYATQSSGLGSGICVTTTASTNITVQVWYAQF